MDTTIKKGDRVKPRKESSSAIGAKGKVIWIYPSTEMNYAEINWDKKSYPSVNGGEISLGEKWFIKDLQLADETSN
ncbi:hypothetical protein AAGG74_16175 [Bacillus mexicanus]|uniref:hypothetical protein n=1 Tax=Bacillus mexicanus TaxID=2834415 RepID=UPI003D1D3935